MDHESFLAIDLDEMESLFEFSIDSPEFFILVYTYSHFLDAKVYLQPLIKIFHRKMFMKISLIFSIFMAYINEFLQNSIY
jgi:hypothetical protein